MSAKPFISVIIVDYKINNPLLKECLDAVASQSYQKFETILLTDYPVKLKYKKLIKRSYGHYVGPAQKRDAGAKIAHGEILAFLDEDAYPSKDWLKNIANAFKDGKVAAVGGPGATPPKSPWSEQLSGWFSASPVGGGPFTYRFLPGKKMEVDDYPSMNLSVRKEDFNKVGGFDSNYWPGEDTKLCLDLVHKQKKKIIYDPKVLVYHRRRPLLRPHLRQNGNYGVHRGYFARILPETSFRIEYFGPSFLLLGIIYLLLYRLIGFNHPWLNLTYNVGLLALSLYLLLILFNAFWIFNKSESLIYGVASIPITAITHIWYGLKFIQGFFSTRKIENSNQKY